MDPWWHPNPQAVAEYHYLRKNFWARWQQLAYGGTAPGHFKALIPLLWGSWQQHGS
jgi:hypothetical protein